MSTQGQVDHVAYVEPRPSLIMVAHLVYGLHAVSLAIGAFGAASMVGSFLFGWPSIIAVVLNYAMRGDTRGTWLESHFRWQIATFWWALLWGAGIAAVAGILMLVLIGFVLWPIGFILLGLWASVRVIRGWLRLKDGKPMVF